MNKTNKKTIQDYKQKSILNLKNRIIIYKIFKNKKSTKIS